MKHMMGTIALGESMKMPVMTEEEEDDKIVYPRFYISLPPETFRMLARKGLAKIEYKLDNVIVKMKDDDANASAEIEVISITPITRPDNDQKESVEESGDAMKALLDDMS